MPGEASVSQGGLQRDLLLIRRRAWLFAPFFVLGILTSLAFGSFAGDSNAAATMQIETVINDAVIGGDRGLRIFEAQSMTLDPAFQEKVRAAIGDTNFEYSRFVIALSPISVADGVSKGILTVSVKDASKTRAEELRAAWVQVFAAEFTELTGLFRERFVSLKQQVADSFEKDYQDLITSLKAADLKGAPIDELLRSGGAPDSLVAHLNQEEARLRSEHSQVTAAILAGPTGAQASAIFGVAVTDAGADAALRARRDILNAAINDMASRRLAISDVSLDPAVLVLVDAARTAGNVRTESFLRLNNARVAVTSAQSNIATGFSSSGGVAGTLIGRIAVVIAVTIVFGLIAIYLWEWLAQVRSGSTPSTTRRDSERD